MTIEEQAIVKSKPEWWRIAKFAPMKASGKISEEQYDYILHRIPYTNSQKTYGALGTDHGASPEAVDTVGSADVVQSSEGRGEAEQDIGADAQCSQAEFVNSLSLPVDSPNGVDIPIRVGKVDNTSQKARLLSLLMDGREHDTPSIQSAVYGGNHLGCARIAARIGELREEGHHIETKKISKTISSYRLVDKKIEDIARLMASG